MSKWKKNQSKVGNQMENNSQRQIRDGIDMTYIRYDWFSHSCNSSYLLLYNVLFKVTSPELRLIQSSITSKSMKDIWYWYNVESNSGTVFGRAIGLCHEAFIRLLSIFLLPVESSLFTLPWTECFVSSSVQNAQGSIIWEWPSYNSLSNQVKSKKFPNEPSKWL